MGKSLVIVESPAKARTIAGYLGGGYAVESSIGHIRDLPGRARDVPEADRKRFGASASTSRTASSPTTSSTRARRRSSPSSESISPTRTAPPCNGRRSRRRGHRMAPRRGTEAEGARSPWSSTRSRRRPSHLDRAGDRQAPGGCAGDAQDPRPPLRIRGVARPLEEVTRGLSAGRVQPVATRLVVERERERMAFTSAEYRICSRPSIQALRGSADRARWRARRTRTRLHTVRGAQRTVGDPSRRGSSEIARRSPRRRLVQRPVSRRATISAEACRAVSNGNTPTGGEPQAPLFGPDDHAAGTAALRSWPHHVHAHGLDHAFRVGARRRPSQA